MNRLVCVVEGHGEVAALPNLCARILHYLGATGWVVDQDPVRQPRNRLVDEREKSPRRPCLRDGIERTLALARARGAHAVLIVCDSDDDCPAASAPDADRAIATMFAGRAVMVVREFETWLLWGRSAAELRRARIADPERMRDAKAALARIVPGYLPTLHQLELTRRLDVGRLRERSQSFDKLVRAVAASCGLPEPSPSFRRV